MRERTLVLVKPDGIQRGLAGEIVSRLESRGLRIVGLRMLRVNGALAKRHYAEHEGKPFFDGLIAYITSSPIIAAVLEGTRAIEVVRKTIGATNPADADPGTIRGDLSVELGRNLIHGSDGPDSATREIALFFDESQLFDYERDVDRWIFEDAS
ncbi:MAG: nucleoside-diphosphate kinase [Chloroflexi bacterium]|nr:nucleoside-diphosphate kinase [Chloroflexota bacterium]MCI0814148.1 nucleoside-diphosphate kinase [Chloroflexota bacterium]MCI0816927.1 nucleoside-diphosphate kinase [Chloroflexota bacterium]MCI0818790.1 nucleoside-diphosphate kinase [Chloroflexota bacterium]MCI0831351.1 nucleoside-diphosphate kinase [Chloroflexota bacterium]